MSRIVERAAIDGLVTLVQTGPRGAPSWQSPPVRLPGRSARLDADAIGDLLIVASVENVLAVHRDVPLTELPGPADGYWRADYRWRRCPRLEPLVALGLLDAYEWACSECVSWYGSPAQQLIETLRRQVIECLPGYSATAWTKQLAMPTDG